MFIYFERNRLRILEKLRCINACYKLIAEMMGEAAQMALSAEMGSSTWGRPQR